MLLFLIVLFLIVTKFQLYPMLKQSHIKDVLIYVLIFITASVLLVMITKDINSINLVK